MRICRTHVKTDFGLPCKQNNALALVFKIGDVIYLVELEIFWFGQSRLAVRSAVTIHSHFARLKKEIERVFGTTVSGELVVLFENFQSWQRSFSANGFRFLLVQC